MLCFVICSQLFTMNDKPCVFSHTIYYCSPLSISTKLLSAKLCCSHHISFTVVNYFNTVMKNAVSCLCVWFCLHTILIKAKIWHWGSIPVVSPLIRQEGCQLWALCCRLNSQTSPLNWTLELSMCTECLSRPAFVFTERVGCRHNKLLALGRLQFTVKFVVDPSSAVSLRGLERIVTYCKWRGGNGSL